MNKEIPLLVIISCSFWCIFEIINIRLQNWFYINLPSEILQRYAGYILSYGTVIPAIYVTKELFGSLIGKIETRHIRLRCYPVYSISLGMITIVLACIYPEYYFSFAWVFLTLVLDGNNYLKGYASFMKDLEAGCVHNFISTMLSGFLCGILWETWNFWSVSKWIYTVPFFEELKLFEMPIPGYIGFLVFSFEVVAFLNLIQGIKIQKKHVIPVILCCFIFSIFSFMMIDRHTVFSYATNVEKLNFIEREKLNSIVARGIKTSYGIEQSILDRKEMDSINLLHLKGMGFENFLKLGQHGINNVRDLAMLDDNTLAEILGEKNLRRMRVYINAAKNSKER